MSKATDIIGGLGSVATSAINAWNGANPITGVSETANNINMLGNTQYAPGDLTNLLNQFTAATNIQTNGLLNRQNETFGQLFASGLNGMVAGQQLGNAIDGIKFTKKAPSSTQEEVDPASIVFNGYSQAYGGHLHSLGGDIAGLAGAVLNPALMAISGAVQDNKMNKLSDQFNVLSNLALQRNVQNLSNAITDSTNMMFDQKAVQIKSYGGPLGCFWDTFDNGVRVIKEGGTHEENPNQGVPQGIAPDGLPNLVEEGEVIYNDFVYSDRLKLTKEQAQQFKLGGEMSYAQAALKLSKESEERPNDIISKNGLRDSMNKLKVMQEELKAKNDAKKAKRELNKLLKEFPVMEEQPVQPSMQEQMIDPMSMIQQPQMMAKGGHLFAKDGQMTNWYDGLDWKNTIEALDNQNNQAIVQRNGQYALLPADFDRQSNMYNGQKLHLIPGKDAVIVDGVEQKAATPDMWVEVSGDGTQPLPQDHMADVMRMAPVWGSLAQAIQAASAKPNYQHQDAAIRAASQIPYVNYTPIGNYERFDRIDPNSQVNALRAQYAQAIGNMQNSGASRAAVNALQTNALQGLVGALGEAEQTGRTYNNTLKEKELTTQLGIDQVLLNASLDASKTNQGRASTYAQMIGAMAPAKQAIDDAIETNKYTTQTAVVNNLGNVGIDKLNRLMQQWMIERGVYPGIAPTKATGGKLKYKTYRKKK